MSHTKDSKRVHMFKRIFAALLAITFLAGFSQVAYAAEDEGYMEFVTTANLNLRSGPGTSFERITLIPEGTVVFIKEFVPDVYGEYYTFSSVMFGELSGYVASRFITPRPLTPVEELLAQAPLMPLEPWVTFNPPETTSQPAVSEPAASQPEGAPPAVVHQPAPPAINGNIERIAWDTMRHNILTTGTTIQIYDIRSGLTYNVRAFSLGNHADVETLTVQDTEIMRQTSGGFSWEARPVLATFNGRTFAAAIHTMPHAGSTIADNGKNGHICLHFYGSTPHNGNQSWRAEMQAAVMQAFNFQQ